MESPFKPACLLMSGRALGFAASFLIPLVLVRIFDQAEFGTYKQVFLIYSTAYGIAQCGMAESLFYFLPVAPREAGRYVLNALLALAGAGLVCLALLWGGGPSISRWLGNPELSEQIPLIGTYLLLMLAATVLEIAMISRKRFAWAASSYALSDLMRAALYIAPVLLLRRLEWLLFGAVAFAALRLCMTLAYIRYEFPGELRPDPSLFKIQLGYALPFELAVVVESIQANLHQYAVSYHFDAATFAIYSVGCLQIPLVEFIGASVANVMMVRMAEELREDRPETVLAMWRDTTRKLALVFLPLVGFLLVNAREIIVFLFTQRYLASVPVFRIWSLAIALSVLTTDAVLRVYAQTRFLFLLNMVRLLLIAGSIHWFLSTFQLPGAVLVTLFATLVAKGWAVARVRHLMHVEPSDILPWRGLAAISAVAALASLPVLGIKSVVDTPAWFLLVITGLVYVASYLALVYVSGILSRSERLAIAAWVQRWHGPVAGTEGIQGGVRGMEQVPVRKE